MEDKKTNQIANMDMTKKGGHPLWYMLSRDVKEQKISLNEAGNKALQFLKEHKFKDLEVFESTQYDNIRCIYNHQIIRWGQNLSKVSKSESGT